MPWQDSSPASFLAATCPKRAWEGEEPFPFFCVFWIAISKNSLYFGFGLWRLHKLLLFVVFLICSFHTSVREIVGTNRTSETQDFMQMKSPHWVCGRDSATCSTRKRQTMEWRRTGSGIKSVRSWIREISRSDLSQTPPTSQKPGSVRRKIKKKRVAVTWHKQELCYCILTKFQYYFGSVMSMAWVSELGTALRTQKKHSLTKEWSATLKEKLYIR